jgi:hypothetical protein
VHCICNCILHRNCSILRFFLCMWLAFMLMLTIFHHPKANTICLASFLALTKKRRFGDGKPHFFSCKKAHQTKSICLRMVKNCQHQHKDKAHTQEKFQDDAISVKEVIKLFRGVNLSGAHCTSPLCGLYYYTLGNMFFRTNVCTVHLPNVP